MTSRLGPRFPAEATFIVAVAVVAGLLSLGWIAIVAAMVAAWLAVAVVEISLSSRAAADGERDAAATQGDADAPAHPLVAEPGVAPGVEPAQPTPWEREEDEDVSPQEAPKDDAPPDRGPDGAEEPQPGRAEPAPAPADRAVTARPAAPVPLARVPAPPSESPPPELSPDADPGARETHVSVRVARDGPREWNLWDLESRARERAGEDPLRDEEWASLLMYLREFASADGDLPVDFDPLVRGSFGELISSDTS